MADEKEKTMECCYECKRGFIMVHARGESNGNEICIPSCIPGQEYNPDFGKCKSCDVGKYSNGGLEPCLLCRDLGYPNSRVDLLRGCISCGLRSFNDGYGTQCIPCREEEFVPPGKSACQRCPTQGAYYLPDIL